MAILKIARMGHPVLLRAAEPVPDPTLPDIRRLIADMEKSIKEADAFITSMQQVR